MVEVTTNQQQDDTQGTIYDNALSIYPEFAATAIKSHDFDISTDDFRNKFQDLNDEEYRFLSTKFNDEYKSGPKEYMPKSGDGWENIAKQFNIYEQDLRDANPGIENPMQGQGLIVGGTMELNESRARRSREINYTKGIAENVDTKTMNNIIGYVETESSSKVLQGGEDPYSIRTENKDTEDALGRYQIKFSNVKAYQSELKERGFDINTEEEFLANPEAQDAMMDILMKKEYSKNVTNLRQRYTKNASKYSDFELMLGIHKLGYNNTREKLSKGSFQVGMVKNQKGETIDLEVGSYIEKARDFMKSESFDGDLDNILFKSEDRFNTGYFADQVMIHSDFANPLVRRIKKDQTINKATSISTNPTVYANGDVLYGERSDGQVSSSELDNIKENNPKLYEQISRGQTEDLDGNIHYVGVMNSFYDAVGSSIKDKVIAKGIKVDTQTGVLMSNYDNLLDEMYADVLSQLEQFSTLPMFKGMEEHFAFDAIYTKDDDELFEAMESEELEGFDEDAIVIGSSEVSDLSNRKIRRALKKDGSVKIYGLSERIKDQLVGFVEGQISQAFEDSFLPQFVGEDMYNQYNAQKEQYEKDNEEFKKRVNEGKIGKSASIFAMGAQYSPGGANLANRMMSNERERIGDTDVSESYYDFVLNQLNERFDSDKIPNVQKEAIALKAAERHWWETSGAGEEHARQMAILLDKNKGIIDPEAANQRAFEVYKTLVEDGQTAPWQIAQAMNREARGAVKYFYRSNYNGTFEIVPQFDEENYKKYINLNNQVHKAVEKKYPKDSAIESSFEYLWKESINKNTIGLIYRAFMGEDFFDTYGYNASDTEQFWTEVGSFVFDPAFLAGGAVASTALRLTTRIGTSALFRNSVSGLARMEALYGKAGADSALKLYQSTIMSSQRYRTLDGVLRSGGAFSTFGFTRDVVTQVDNLGSFQAVDYAQSLNAGGKEGLLGLGIGATAMRFSRYRRLMSKRGVPEYKQLWVEPASFTAEVGVFTVGGSILHDAPLNWQSFEDNAAFIAGLKITHSALASRKNLQKRWDNYKDTGSIWNPTMVKNRFDFIDITEHERRVLVEELGLPKDATKEQIFQAGFGKVENLSKIIGNEKLDPLLYDKILFIGTGSQVNYTHRNGTLNAEAMNSRMAHSAETVVQRNPSSGKKEYVLMVKNKNGDVLTREIYQTEKAASENLSVIERGIRSEYNTSQVSMLKSEYSVSDFNRILRENNVTEADLQRYIDKDYNQLGPEVREKLDKVMGEIESANLSRSLESRESSVVDFFAKPEKAEGSKVEMKDGDPALYGQYLRMQKEGKEMTAEQKAELERIESIKNEKLDKTYEEVMGEPRPEVKEVTPEKAEVKPEEAAEVKTEEAPVEGESKTYYHGASGPKPKFTLDSKRYSDGVGTHFGVTKEQPLARAENTGAKDFNIYEYKVDYKNALKVDRDFVWEGNDALEKRFKEDPNAYSKEREANKELGIESDWFGDYLLDNNIVTVKELQADPSPAGIRKLLLEKGFDAIDYLNTGEVAKGGKPDRSIIALTPDIIKEIGAKPEVKSEAQIEADAIKAETVPAVEKKQPKLSTEKQTFTQELDKAKSERPEDYWSVDRVEPSDLKSGKLIEVEGGYGVVSKDGEIKGVFKKSDSKEKGVGDNVIQEAVAEGGRKLDNFDGYLTSIYEKNGFVVVGRTKFNEQFAPEGYNKEKHGSPDVVAMVYDPMGKLNIKEKKFSSYEEMMAYRDKLAEQSRSQYPTLTEKQKARKKVNERIKTIRSEYQQKISEIKGNIKAERQAVNEVKQKVTEVINEMEFKAPIKKRLLKQAVNIRNEKGIDKFVDAVENANHRQDIANKYEDISSLTRAIEKKMARGELSEGVAGAAVRDLLNLDIRSLDVSYGTEMGQKGVKALNELISVYEQLSRPRVAAVTGKSSPKSMEALNSKINSLLEQVKSSEQSIVDNKSAESVVENLNKQIEKVNERAEDFEFEYENLTGSEKRNFANVMRGLRDGRKKIEEAYDNGIIEGSVYRAEIEKINRLEEQMGERRAQYIDAQYNEGIGFLNEVLNNRSEYPEYSDSQIEMIRRLTKAGKYESIGWAEDLYVSALDIASGYFPPGKVGGLLKDASAFQNGNALYKQINTGLEGKYGDKVIDKTAPQIATEMGTELTVFLADKSRAEGTGTTLDTKVVAPMNRAMTESSTFVNKKLVEFGDISKTGVFGIGKETSLQRRKKMTKLGMLMQIRQHELGGGKGDFVGESLFNTKFSKNFSNKKELEFLREIYNGLPKKKVDGKEVVDWDASYKSLSASEKKIYDYVREQFDGEIFQMQKESNNYRGESFEQVDGYFPRYRRGVSADKSELQWYESMFNQNVKIQATAGKERTMEDVSAMEYNLERVFQRSVVESSRDFFMTPIVGETTSILNSSIRKAQEMNSPNTETYLSAYKLRLQDALQLHFDANYERAFGDKLIGTTSSASYAGRLVRPWRVGIEYLTETYRVGIGAGTKETPAVFIKEHFDRLRVAYNKIASVPSAIGSMVKGEGFKLDKTKTTTNELLEFTKSPYFQRFNRFSIEGNYDMIGNIYQSGLVKSLSDYAISAPDRATMHLAWQPTFRVEFERITGDKFSDKTFREDPSYRELYRDEIFDAAAIADREAGKWKNAAIKGQARTMIPTPFGKISAINTSTMANIATYMSSFGALESAMFGKSVRDVAFGSDSRSRIKSFQVGFTQFSAGVGYSTATAAEYMYAQYVLAGSNPDLSQQERVAAQDEIRQQYNDLFTPAGLLKSVQSNAAFLATSKYGAFGRSAVLLTAAMAQDIIGEDTTIKDVLPDFIPEGFTGDEPISKWVEDFTQRAYLTSPVDLQGYGRGVDYINSLAPMIGFGLDVTYDGIDAIRNSVEAFGDDKANFVNPEDRQKAVVFDTMVKLTNVLLLTQGTQIPFSKEINRVTEKGVAPGFSIVNPIPGKDALKPLVKPPKTDINLEDTKYKLRDPQ